MRAAVSHLFGIHPWQYEHLTDRELRTYVGQAEAHIREARHASKTAR